MMDPNILYILSCKCLRTPLRCVTAHSSGGDRHVVPVAGLPLGTTVAAQVLVYAGHLVSGHIIRHLQVWVVAVRLRAA